MSSALTSIHQNIHRCQKCPRLIEYIQDIAQKKRKAFIDQTYWGKPVSGWGDENAKILILGLAPAAHGANRTGRMFTGDRSGDWLYRAMHKAGLANQAQCIHSNDGLKLKNAYVTSVGKCAPPQNKPEKQELQNCESHLLKEFQSLKKVKVILCLGALAFDRYWKIFLETHKPVPKPKKPKFKHGLQLKLENSMTLVCSYHPSQQNTFTGKLTEKMFDSVFKKAVDASKS